MRKTLKLQATRSLRRTLTNSHPWGSTLCHTMATRGGKQQRPPPLTPLRAPCDETLFSSGFSGPPAEKVTEFIHSGPPPLSYGLTIYPEGPFVRLYLPPARLPALRVKPQKSHSPTTGFQYYKNVWHCERAEGAWRIRELFKGGKQKSRGLLPGPGIPGIGMKKGYPSMEQLLFSGTRKLREQMEGAMYWLKTYQNSMLRQHPKPDCQYLHPEIAGFWMDID